MNKRSRNVKNSLVPALSCASSLQLVATSGFCGPDLCLFIYLSFSFLLALGFTPGLLTFSACVLSLCHPPSNSLDSGARLLRFTSQLCHVLCVAIRSHLSFLSLRSLTCGMELREVSAFAVVVGGLKGSVQGRPGNSAWRVVTTQTGHPPY